MELPAIEIFTRSRNATALRTNSQKMRNQRTWLVRNPSSHFSGKAGHGRAVYDRIINYRGQIKRSDGFSETCDD